MPRFDAVAGSGARLGMRGTLPALLGATVAAALTRGVTQPPGRSEICTSARSLAGVTCTPEDGRP